MKTMGLLGGMSWASTATYYKALNEGINQSLGGLHSAKICLYSVDFEEIEKLQAQGMWQESADILAKAAQSVEAAGADFLIICTNTMHKVAPEIEAAVSIPLLHIADATAQQLILDKIDCVGLLGTKFTMEQQFYKSRLSEKYGINVLVPQEQQRARVHDVIYSELCHGEINASAREDYLAIIEQLHQQGAQAIILGCTEIGLLIQQELTHIPLYDTTQIHAAQAVKFAISDE